MATALKKLRDLATDAVVLPTREDLYHRKCADIDAAKAERCPHGGARHRG